KPQGSPARGAFVGKRRPGRLRLRTRRPRRRARGEVRRRDRSAPRGHLPPRRCRRAPDRSDRRDFMRGTLSGVPQGGRGTLSGVPQGGQAARPDSVTVASAASAATPAVAAATPAVAAATPAAAEAATAAATARRALLRLVHAEGTPVEHR